jgi:hypothetical protein
MPTDKDLQPALKRRVNLIRKGRAALTIVARTCVERAAVPAKWGGLRAIRDRQCGASPIRGRPDRRNGPDLAGVFFGYDYQMLLIVFCAPAVGAAAMQPQGLVRLSECLNG